MRDRVVLLVMVFFLAASGAAGARAENEAPRELSIEDATHLAEKVSPRILIGEAQESQEKAGKKIAQAGYYPSLDFGVLDSTGFPGSTGSSLGIWGLTASPFRSGVAGGFFSRVSVFDRSRDYGVDEADKRIRSSEDQTELLRSQVDQEVLQMFMDAARSRAHLETWRFMEEESQKVSAIVNRLVRTGQHSEVSKLLVEDQVTRAKLNRILYEKQYAAALTRLALLTGVPEGSLACPPSTALQESDLGFLHPTGTNPLVRRAESELQLARTTVSKNKAEYLPKVFAVGSTGMMEATRLVPKNDYAAAIGIDFPIFEGFRMTSETQRAEARVQQRESELDDARLELGEVTAKYDEVIDVSRQHLLLLDQEYDAATRALRLAKQRYLLFQGLLVDVREALNNLGRIRSEMNDARADLILAVGSRAILQGAAAR